MKNSKIKILLVDDRPHHLHCLSKILTEQGYKVEKAINGKIALNAAIAEPPNLILLHILMPDINGYEVCQRLKQMDKTREIPIIFLGNFDRAFDKVKAFKVGGADYITEPFPSEEVLARIESQLNIQELQKHCRFNAELKQGVIQRTLALEVTNQELEREITENKLLEQKLRSTDVEMRAFFEAMTDIVIILDKQANNIKIAPTRALVANELSNDIINLTVEQFYKIPQAEIFLNRIQRAIKVKHTVNFEYSLLLKGEEIWFSADISPISEDTVIWVARDITHRVRAELELQKLASKLERRVLARTAQLQDANKILLAEICDRSTAESALRESERRFRAIFNNSFQFTGLLKPDGTLIEANQTALNFAGIQHTEMAGMPFWEARLWTISKETQEQLKAAIARATTGEFVRYEVDVLGMGDKVTTIDFSLKPVIDETGEVVLLIPEGRDITDRKQAEAALQQAKEVAETASIAKSRFLSTMSHELRTPLNAILGFTQIMVRDSSLSQEHTEYLEIINRSGEHLLGLINDILSMSKIESGRMVLNENSFDLYQLLHSLEELLQLKAKSKGLALIFQYPPDLPQYIQTDESKLRQVLINLLGNAIKFTSQGSITLRVGTNQEQLTAECRQVTLIFEVEDTGPGIALGELDILFNPFIQTQTGRQSMEGTGLGLSISRQFVRLMGGEISVSSTVGKGAIFKFHIQASLITSVSEDKKAIAKRILSLELNQPNYRILVVEDIAENRQLLIKLLEPLKLEVRTAINGEQAVALWQDWEPHLIFMDIQMPVMDGYEATKQIRAKSKGQHPVIIALTASAFEEQRSAILAAGCDDFVCKPFREEILFEKIAHYLGVCYIYEPESQPSASQAEKNSEALTIEDFKAMPFEWVAELHTAALCINDLRIIELIELIPQTQTKLSNTLTDLVNNFRLDLIINLTQAYNE